jgi:hypothetical protein
MVLVCVVMVLVCVVMVLVCVVMVFVCVWCILRQDLQVIYIRCSLHCNITNPVFIYNAVGLIHCAVRSHVRCLYTML